MLQSIIGSKRDEQRRKQVTTFEQKVTGVLEFISLKGHCHEHFLAFLVKWHQNYD